MTTNGYNLVGYANGYVNIDKCLSENIKRYEPVYKERVFIAVK